MTPDTCAVLTAIFPLVLVTVAVERRSVHVKIGRAPWFRWVVQATVAAALIGLILTVAGVQFGGLSLPYAAFAWLSGFLAFGGLTFSLIASIATFEVAEDGPAGEADAKVP